MFCPKCGRENPDRNKFCNGCGAAMLRSVAPPQQFTPPVETPQLQTPPPLIFEPAARTSPSPLVVGLAIVAALIGLIFVANWFFNKNRDAELLNTANTSVTQTSPKTPEGKSPTPHSYEGMVFVPGGEFMMGRNDGKSESEKPAHKVTVKPFYMDVYETTNEQYAAFIKATGTKPPPEWENGNYSAGKAKFPVVGVNWENADAYAKWMGKRLPTEEEWEFAARGTNNYLYPWGNSWQLGNANANGASQNFMEVGRSKGASPFGIYDMSGNAWEWTASDFKAYPNGKLPAAFAGKTNLKTIRGGSFEATRDFATTTYRIGWAATGAESYSRTGFRCAKDAEK